MASKKSLFSIIAWLALTEASPRVNPLKTLARRQASPSATCPDFNPTEANLGDLTDFADPGLIKVDDSHWYAYSTEYPGTPTPAHVPIAVSEDLISWTRVTNSTGGLKDAMPSLPSWVNGTGSPGYTGSDYLDPGVWAPDVAYWNGQYSLLFSAFQGNHTEHCIGVATSSDPEGPFTPTSDQEPLICVPYCEGGDIDASQFHDPVTGNYYVTYKIDGGSINATDTTCSTGSHSFSEDNPIRTPLILQQVDPSSWTLIGQASTLLENMGSDEAYNIEAPSLVYIPPKDGSSVASAAGTSAATTSNSEAGPATALKAVDDAEATGDATAAQTAVPTTLQRRQQPAPVSDDCTDEAGAPSASNPGASAAIGASGASGAGPTVAGETSAPLNPTSLVQHGNAPSASGQSQTGLQPSNAGGAPSSYPPAYPTTGPITGTTSSSSSSTSSGSGSSPSSPSNPSGDKGLWVLFFSAGFFSNSSYHTGYAISTDGITGEFKRQPNLLSSGDGGLFAPGGLTATGTDRDYREFAWSGDHAVAEVVYHAGHAAPEGTRKLYSGQAIWDGQQMSIASADGKSTCKDSEDETTGTQTNAKADLNANKKMTGVSGGSASGNSSSAASQSTQSTATSLGSAQMTSA
ncbi:MAG: hypothetical protein Q9162_006146 [Coniocarpon cinnabarinum]